MTGHAEVAGYSPFNGTFNVVTVISKEFVDISVKFEWLHLLETTDKTTRTIPVNWMIHTTSIYKQNSECSGLNYRIWRQLNLDCLDFDMSLQVKSSHCVTCGTSQFSGDPHMLHCLFFWLILTLIILNEPDTFLADSCLQRMPGNWQNIRFSDLKHIK